MTQYVTFEPREIFSSLIAVHNNGRLTWELASPTEPDAAVAEPKRQIDEADAELKAELLRSVVLFERRGV